MGQDVSGAGRRGAGGIGADFLSIFVLNIPRIFFNIANFFLRKFQSCAAL